MHASKIKKKSIIALWCASILLIISTLITIVIIKNITIDQIEIEHKKNIVIDFTNNIYQASNKMTEQSREFSITMNTTAITDFWETYSNLQILINNKLSVVNKNINAQEHRNLAEILQNIDELNETNMKIFILMLKAYSTPSTLFPEEFKYYRLLDHQEQLSSAEKIKYAKSLTYKKTYKKHISNIDRDFNILHSSVITRTSAQIKEASDHINNYILLIIILNSINLLVIISIVWIRALEQ